MYPDYSKSSILEWINKTIKNNAIFAKNSNISSNILTKSTDDGKYFIPTHGTYTKYMSSKIVEEF